MGSIRYPFALDKKGILTSIEDVGKRRQHECFYCPECGAEMRPRLGKNLAHHFCHVEHKDCNLSTYVRRVGKLIIYQRLCADGPFVIKYLHRVKCAQYDECEDRKKRVWYLFDCKDEVWCERDLKKDYDTVELDKEVIFNNESCYATCNADIVLSSSTNPAAPPFVIVFSYKIPCDYLFEIGYAYNTMDFYISEAAYLMKLKKMNEYVESTDPGGNVHIYFPEDGCCDRDHIINQNREGDVPCTESYKAKYKGKKYPF